MSVQQPPKLKVIGSVTSRAASALVKAGTTADVYSINAVTQDKASGWSAAAAPSTAPGRRSRRFRASSSPRARPATSVSGSTNGANDFDPRRRLRPDRLRARRYPRQPRVRQLSVRLDFRRSVSRSSKSTPVRRRRTRRPKGSRATSTRSSAPAPVPARATSTSASARRRSTTRSRSKPAAPTRAVRSRTTSGLGAYNQAFRYYDQYNGASLQSMWGAPLRLAPTRLRSGATVRTGKTTRTAAPRNPTCWGRIPSTPAAEPDQPRRGARPRHRRELPLRDPAQRRKPGRHPAPVRQQLHRQSDCYNSTNDQGGAAFLDSIGVGAHLRRRLPISRVSRSVRCCPPDTPAAA